MVKVDRREVSPEDDGDYAKLRELPMVTRAVANDHCSDDNTSEDTKVKTHRGDCRCIRPVNMKFFKKKKKCF